MSEAIVRSQKIIQEKQAVEAKQFGNLKSKAEKGDAQAQFTVAEHYSIGDGGAPRDSSEALRWMRLAAEHGLDKAQARLGWWYHGGAVAGTRGVASEDWVEAAKWYHLAAEQNEGNACTMLGVILSQGGHGLQKDTVAAVAWWRKAAELGDALGQVNLGGSYQFGTGIAKDGTEAVKWYRKAAEQGDDNGQLHLAYCYAAGDGVPKDLVLAEMWLQIITNTSDNLHGIIDVLRYHQERIEAQLTPAQIAEAIMLARNFKPVAASATTAKQ